MTHDHRYYRRRIEWLCAYELRLRDRLALEYQRAEEFFLRRHRPPDTYALYSLMLAKVREEVGLEICEDLRRFLY
jgi:hypothetical protein